MTWGRKIRWPQAAVHRLGSQIHVLNASSEQAVEKVFTALADLRAEGCL
jgi:hypothetical protein